MTTWQVLFFNTFSLKHPTKVQKLQYSYFTSLWRATRFAHTHSTPCAKGTGALRRGSNPAEGSACEWQIVPLWSFQDSCLQRLCVKPNIRNKAPTLSGTNSLSFKCLLFQEVDIILILTDRVLLQVVLNFNENSPGWLLDRCPVSTISA